MALHDALTQRRKSAMDRLFGGWRFSFSSSEVTRVGAWLCLFAAIARFQEHVGWAFAFLLVALILDILDGVVARQRGENSPEIDWAADRYGELVFVGALFARDPLWAAIPYTACYIANVFLPIKKIPVLPLRHALGVYLLVVFLRGLNSG